METLGQKLRKAREHKGLSVEEIVKITKISERNILALENDKPEELPSQTYIKGFLKLYANTVGLDPFVLIEDYQKSKMPEIKQVLVLNGKKMIPPGILEILLKTILESIKKVPLKIWAGMGSGTLLGVLVAILIKSCAHEHVNQVEQRQESTPIVQDLSASSLIKPQLVAKTPAPIQNELIKTDSDDVQTSIIPTQVKIMPNKSTPSSAVNDSLILIGKVKEPVWLRIYCDNKLIFEGTLKKGVRETWKAADYFKLRIGNPDAIDFSLNGKELGRIGPPGPSKIRDVRLTKDGWFIKD